MWRQDVRKTVLEEVAEYVQDQCARQLAGSGIDVAGEVLLHFVSGGKCLRPTFMYLGWLCGAEPDRAALRACAGLELLHAFALLQDDVMDDSAMRRGRQAAHVEFAQWHGERRLSGCAQRFGASAAVLLSDLCLVWAEQMMRESGVDQRALARTWHRYDAMRVELALGQFADIVNDAGALPKLDAVLDVARRKSGNYTVRRPLEIGAALAGREDLIPVLGNYGSLVGEAFQLRDDILGVFGSPGITGKPAGGDLAERKATSVVVTAYHLADASTRRQLSELICAKELTDHDIDHWRALIVASGAVQWIEDMIVNRVNAARDHVSHSRIDGSVQGALAYMADICTARAT
ncbi:MAG: polyprenyl synthetase family protein [Actinomycetia bacterium]|nr:polyprenyl synthetase family protein [Actinomycetes bacterium]